MNRSNEMIDHGTPCSNQKLYPDCTPPEFDGLPELLLIAYRLSRLADLILTDVDPNDAVEVLGQSKGRLSGAATDVDGHGLVRW